MNSTHWRLILDLHCVFVFRLNPFKMEMVPTWMPASGPKTRPTSTPPTYLVFLNFKLHYPSKDNVFGPPKSVGFFMGRLFRLEVLLKIPKSSLDCNIWRSFCSFFYSRVYQLKVLFEKWWVSNRIQSKEKGISGSIAERSRASISLQEKGIK